MASRSVNKAFLLGNLTKDAETKFTPSGIARTALTVATNRRWKDNASGDWKEETDFHNVVLWRSENLANYLLKGKQVYVEGRISNRSYEQDGVKKFFTEVVADEVILLGGKSEERAESASAQARRGGSAGAGRQAPKEDAGKFGITDDDVPFIIPLTVETRWV